MADTVISHVLIVTVFFVPDLNQAHPVHHPKQTTLREQ